MVRPWESNSWPPALQSSALPTELLLLQLKLKTHRWRKAAVRKAGTESFIITAQDLILPTRWYQHNILKKPDMDP